MISTTPPPTAMPIMAPVESGLSSSTSLLSGAEVAVVLERDVVLLPEGRREGLGSLVVNVAASKVISGSLVSTHENQLSSTDWRSMKVSHRQ